MKSHARVVVVGGGVMGVGLLYHLALEGWTDIALVEKGELTSGSTWHAAGQCPHFNGSLNMTKVHVYGTQLYSNLEKLTGHAVSWHGCGGLRLATSDEEVDWFKYVYGISRLAGYECEIIGPSEIKTYHPFLEPFGVKAAFRTVHDGHVAPADITNAMAAGARKLGAEIHRRTLVTDIRRLTTGEWEVITDKGNIICEHVVNSAGSYCDVVGSWTGHNVPIANMLHHYVITEPMQELIDLAPELPVVRDPHSHAYLREETNGVLVGPYETATAHVCWEGKPPAWDFESELIAPELDRLVPWLERAAERFPLFGKAGLKNVVSGAITHTPDGTYLSGPAHGPRNYWMHCGASIGICQGGGAGKYLAQWMVHGQAEINMREFDPRRFGNWATKDYTAEVSVADYHHMYYCYKPGEQHEVGRGLRKSSLYDRLKAEGAQFSQIFGWERPRWYDKTGNGETFSFRRSNWWDAVREEALAVRERVGLMDLSTFSKYDVTGKDAYGFLERICANKIPVKDGGIILGHLLNANGFIESEITVTRLNAEHFYVLSAAVAQLHDFDQLNWRKTGRERVTISDITDDYGVLVLAGPRARDVLGASTKTDLSNASFRWLTGKVAEVAGVARVRLLRVNYVGELGWELHVPMAAMPKVYRCPDGGRQAARHQAVRNLCDEFAPHGKGLSWLGFGTHQRDRHDRGVDGTLHPFRQGGFHRQGGEPLKQAARTADETGLHGSRQYRQRLRWQRAGVSWWQCGGGDHIGRLRTRSRQVSGLRLCGPGPGGQRRRIRRPGVRRAAQGTHHSRVNLGCGKCEAQRLKRRHLGG